MEPLCNQQVVRIQTQKGYGPLAVVQRRADRPRSYVVNTGERCYERNRRHLLPVKEHPPDLNADVRSPPATPQRPVTPPRPASPVAATSPPEPPEPPSPLPHSGASPKHTKSVVMTRSGRVVKPNRKYWD